MTDLNWQYVSLGLLLVVMKRAKATVDAVRDALPSEQFMSWRSLYLERLVQVRVALDRMCEQT